MFKRFHNGAAVWTDKELSRLLLQAKNAYQKDEFAVCNRMLDVFLAADPGNPEAQVLKDSIRRASPDVLTTAEEDREAKPRSRVRNALKLAAILVLAMTIGVTAALVMRREPRTAAPPSGENLRTPHRPSAANR